MARAAGKATKKRNPRRRSLHAKKKPVARVDPRVIIGAAATLRRAHTVVVAASALTDPAGTDDLRHGLPALDPALLPEFVLLQHLAIKHFKLHRGSTSCPSKQELINFFVRVPLSNGSKLSKHLAGAMATFVRPPTAMIGGRPSKRPLPSDEQAPGKG
jgi:hypothetical protein